jgi:23S rRNA (uracil1939-C5)-methyltransferase
MLAEPSVKSSLVPDQAVPLSIEKPAVGGRMIARADGQVVLVDGAIPGERVVARIERVARGVAYAETLSVEAASPDRREPPGDRRCGGCLYAHIAYPRQLEIKSQVIQDAFARIGRLALAAPVVVAPSPPDGYRMRARLHFAGGRLGFLREGTHQICDARATRQLLPATCDVLDRLAAALSEGSPEAIREVDVSESVDASERVVHVGLAPGRSTPKWNALAGLAGATGVAVVDPERGPRLISGSPFVSDVLKVGDELPLALRRHGLAFFQGNRFLLADLVAHVAALVPLRSRVVDLYAGGGLFALAAGAWRSAQVTAVEGDSLACADLVANAAMAALSVAPVHQAVETFLESTTQPADVVVADPPRTGMSSEALRGVARIGRRQVVYVSCDVATLARDAKGLVEAGFALTRVDAFDLFPNTPHVETVAVFSRD